MRKSALTIAAALTVASAIASSAYAAMAGNTAANRLTLTLAKSATPDAARSELMVAGRDGKYDRIEPTAVRATVDLSAQSTDAGAFKIVGSRLSLTTGNSTSEPDGIDTMSKAVPSASYAARSVHNLPVPLDGSVALSAIALCNALPAAERTTGAAVRRTMPVTIDWRVTTGTFAFKWTNYDRVAPSDDILRNPDFYADQETQSAETTIDVDVVCAPLPSSAIAAKPAAENPVRRVALTSAPIAQPEAQKPIQEHDVSQADFGKPRCDGGMVRQISTAADGYLCLCPGNTVRVDTGDNAFACERRTRR